MKVKLGQIVLFRTTRKEGETTAVSWPGLVYKLHPKDDKIIGIQVFSDSGIARFGFVNYDKEQEQCWRFMEDEEK